MTIAGVLAVVFFAVLVARFWHPYDGMTRLLQLDVAHADKAIPALTQHPVFIYPHHGGYDGLFYAQIAFDPSLGSPELERALDNPGFRSRRILMSATAWLLAAGNPAHIADVYAWLNIAAWFALAVLLWWMLPVRDGRSWLAWAGVLFSAGALHSVRQSLTDLPALLLVAAGMAAVERGRLRSGVGLLAAAALTRETSVLAAAGPASPDLNRTSAWRRNIAIALAVGVPLACWLGYVRHRFGPGDAGTGNFTWPFLGWLRKGPEILQAYGHPAFRWLVTTTLLATIGLTGQAVFFAVHRRYRDGWWRIGAVHVVLALCLGGAVWEGHPGSFTRILLPLSLAFAVCAVRWRVSPVWLLVGALPVFAGLEPWRNVVHHGDDLSSGRAAGRGYFVHLEDGFFPREDRSHPVRAWSSGEATVELRFTAPPNAEALNVALEVRSFGERTLVVADASATRWQGAIGSEWRSLEFSLQPSADGRWLVHLSSPEPAVREADVPGARELAFAIRDLHVRTAR